MAKTKKKAVLLVVCLMLAVLCAGVLAACNDTETYTVTFMVRENGTTGDWQQYTTVDTGTRTRLAAQTKCSTKAK